MHDRFTEPIATRIMMNLNCLNTNGIFNTHKQKVFFVVFSNMCASIECVYYWLFDSILSMFILPLLCCDDGKCYLIYKKEDGI